MSARPAPLSHPAPASVQPPLSLPAASRQRSGGVMTPSRALLNKRAPHYLTRGGKASADLRLLRLQDTVWVVKDFAARPWWVRWTLGLWLTWHELSALGKLRGVPGVPQTVRRIDRFAFAYLYIEGTPLHLTGHRHLSPAFFRRYERLVESLHQRGIVHLGLREGSNVLVTAEQQPILLDFQTHVCLPRWLSALTALLSRSDFNAISVLWNRYLLAILKEEQQAVQRPRSRHTAEPTS